MSDKEPVGGWPDAEESPELLEAQSRMRAALTALQSQAGRATITKSQKELLLAELAKFRTMYADKSDPEPDASGAKGEA